MSKSSKKNIISVLEIPREVFFSEILPHLTGTELLNVSYTCKILKSYVDNPLSWKFATIELKEEDKLSKVLPLLDEHKSKGEWKKIYFEIAKRYDHYYLKSLLLLVEKKLEEEKEKFEPSQIDEEGIKEMEEEMKMKIPWDLRILMLWTKDTVENDKLGSYLHYGGAKDENHQETGMMCLWNYNQIHPTLFRALNFLPLQMVDYEMCFEAYDLDTGNLLQLDWECENFFILAKSITKAVEMYLKDEKRQPSVKVGRVKENRIWRIYNNVMKEAGFQ